MAFALFWEPAKPAAQIAGDGERQGVLKTLIETFGRDPHHPLSLVELQPSHVFTLKSLAGGQGNTVFGEIADLVEKHGRIRIWGRGE